MEKQMIHFLYGAELNNHPKLKKSMFLDRKSQFIDRLKWDIRHNESGEEIDQYDRFDSLYVIVSEADGSHAGSMRLIPTSKPTMLSEHFSEAIPGISINSDRIWECTRFCISPKSEGSVSASLLAAGGKLMNEMGLKYFVAVFDRRMLKVYRMLGWSPIVLGEKKYSEGTAYVGLWSAASLDYKKLLSNSAYSDLEMELFHANLKSVQEIQKASIAA
jgi:N-acyl-L-homoserine lactone synthetase